MADDWRGYENAAAAEQRPRFERLHSTGNELARKYWIALALYAILAVLVWFTMDAGKVMVWGRPVELRLVPLIVIGGLVLRTVLAMQAERIRRDGEKN